MSFTSTTTGATGSAWTFGDAGTASGDHVSHAWTLPGTWIVQLTATDGRSSAAASRTFVVTGPPVATRKSAVLPWIAQTRGALVQSSDLYLLNPGASAMDVTLTFLKRGLPEASPPAVTRTIQPGATLFVADVLGDLFQRENIAGFVSVEVERGDAEPVITSFNTTVQADGSQFGQTVAGLSTSAAPANTALAPGAAQVHSLIGLNDNAERLAYFGLSNPGARSCSLT